MKAFRSSLVALTVLLVLLGAWWLVQPTDAPNAAGPARDAAVALFPFEKANLLKVEVVRPDGTIVLEERADGWWLANENQRASRTMVNRVKHQLHDLTARATVVDATEDGALYGLGDSAIHVMLTMRDGSTVKFDAGDPNPTGVSFYIRKQGDPAIYTVKKSAVDYYSLSLTEFRERRFAGFDSKDVDAIDATVDGRRLAFQRGGAEAWDMIAPESFAADDGEVRALLGRVTALKAAEFVTDAPTDPKAHGLDAPRARIAVRFSGRDPLTLLVGARTGQMDGEFALAYMQLEGEPSVYTARDALLDDFRRPVVELRRKAFVGLDPNEVAAITVTFAGKGEDAALARTVGLRNEADTWLWEDGVPAAGSTPKRVAQRAAGIRAEAFEAASGSDAAYGFAAPIVRAILRTRDGTVRTLLVGKPAPSAQDDEGAARKRWYARVAEAPEIYEVDDGIVEVARDLSREFGRKSQGDAQKTERHQRIARERGAEGAAE
jgi:hypothetical protein